MKSAVLMPTVTHRVRSFLRAQGANVAPWSGLDETYAELHAMLRRRRDDPALWAPLAQLLREIIDAATDPSGGCLAPCNAELLTSWYIDDLIRDLRAALPRDEPEPKASIDRFLATLTAPVLGGFLLLGLVAAGCGGEIADKGSSAISDSGRGGAAGVGGSTAAGGAAGVGGSTAAGGAAGVGGSSEGRACEGDAGDVVARRIADSSLTVYEKQRLCECLGQMNASWSDGLSQLFETGTDAGIAAALEEMIQCCSYGITSGDFGELRDRFLDGSLCTLARPYKGVSFPDR